MTGQVRVHNFAISLDGFGTGADQSAEAPFGHAGGSLMQWFFGTRRGAAIHGLTSAARGVDDATDDVGAKWAVAAADAQALAVPLVDEGGRGIA